MFGQQRLSRQSDFVRIADTARNSSFSDRCGDDRFVRFSSVQIDGGNVNIRSDSAVALVEPNGKL